VQNYLKVLEATFVVHVVRPFSTHRATEIVAAPKVYGFDTGFVAYFRGWKDARREDLGILWEHFVLNEIQACLQVRSLGYWRDKRGHEVDFIWVPRGRAPLAIECKWTAEEFDATNLRAFRRQYPKGDNLVIASDVARGYTRTFGEARVRFEGLRASIDLLAPP
jgi:predicted AAA+ superfamily ATPase